MSYDSIRAALETALEAYAGTEALSVVYENTETPISETHLGELDEFLEVAHLPIRPENASIGVGGKDRAGGLFQVSVVAHRNTGQGGALRRADSLVSLFSRGERFASGAVVVEIEKSWPSPGFIRGDSYILPVSVLWFSYL